VCAEQIARRNRPGLRPAFAFDIERMLNRCLNIAARDPHFDQSAHALEKFFYSSRLNRQLARSRGDSHAARRRINSFNSTWPYSTYFTIISRLIKYFAAGTVVV
jgi:hypothetical protein